MKILFFTDSHIRGNTPKNRKDNFIETLEKKFLEIASIANDYKVDYILHGGDLFDRPDVSITVVSKFSVLLNKMPAPFYLISGNHDIYGHNPDTVNRTILGLLDILGIIKLINPMEKIILQKNNLKVQLTGQPYVYDIDDPKKRDYYLVKEKDKDINFAIHMVHGMLLDKPFIEGIPYTLIENIKDTLADITLSGHYHGGYKLTKIDNKYFINPGSLTRVTNSLKEIERKPKVVLIDLNKEIQIKEIFLKSALNGEEVLDRREIESSLFKTERMVAFKQSIDSAMDFEKMDINEVLMEVSLSEGVTDDVKKEALKRIAQIQMKGLNGD